MEFPGDWTILDIEDFDTASSPRDPGLLGADVLVQLRDSGRAMDNFRVVVGGSRRIKVVFEAADVFPTSTVPDWRITLECWPRDITIRKNMVTSDWLDVIGMVAANDLTVVDGEGTDCNDELVAFFSKQGGKTSYGAALRWAVGIGPDRRLELLLQCLPATTTYLAGKPTLLG